MPLAESSSSSAMTEGTWLFMNQQCRTQQISRQDSGLPSKLRQIRRRTSQSLFALTPVRPPAARHNFAQVLLRSWGAIPGTPASWAYGLISCQTTFSPRPSAPTRSPRLTERKTRPSAAVAAVVQASIASLTQFGIGTVRTRPCFPNRSTMHQRPSRCWICANVSAHHLPSPFGSLWNQRRVCGYEKILSVQA